MLSYNVIIPYCIISLSYQNRNYFAMSYIIIIIYCDVLRSTKIYYIIISLMLMRACCSYDDDVRASGRRRSSFFQLVNFGTQRTLYILL